MPSAYSTLDQKWLVRCGGAGGFACVFCAKGVPPSLLLIAAVLAGSLLFAQSPKYGVGRAPTPDELAKWESSVAPNGAGLPPGSGTATQGRETYDTRCSKCHGAKGEGRDSVPLAGGQGTLKSPKPLKTVGSFWPHATTVFDYINRAMPFDRPGTLTTAQVYSLTAYVLFLNGVIAEDTVIDARSLPKVEMPNRRGFVADPRPDVGTRREQEKAHKTGRS